MADGEWVSAPMGEFQKDPTMEIVYEYGRPSYFREITAHEHDTLLRTPTLDIQNHKLQTDAQHQSQSVTDLSCMKKPKVELGTTIARKMSANGPRVSIIALAIGSMLYDFSSNTGALYSIVALLFLSVLLEVFSTKIEVNTNLYPLWFFTNDP
jgi:hypothetical protein